VDVHQHLWPALFVEQLRRRNTPPRLDGWTLHTHGEAPWQIDPAAHDGDRRAAAEPVTRRLSLVSLSAPLGVEGLGDEAGALLEAWHLGAAQLPSPFRAWASVSRHEPDLDGLASLLETFVGVQVSALDLATPDALERLAPVLRVAELADRPVLVHPGPANPVLGAVPAWWPALIDYVAQLQAAWWSWHVAGRSLLPGLRICFAAGAGLAPLHHERLRARGGQLGPLDPGVFVDTSSHGRQAVDALVRVLGIDALVLGSDRPYAQPFDLPATEGGLDLGLGPAGDLAITSRNPHRLVHGGTP
jgi:hypothetical protein